LEVHLSSRKACDTCGDVTEKTLRLCDDCAELGIAPLLKALKVAYHSMERGDEAGSPARVGALHQARKAILEAGGEL
jgi:hypothetical protein